MDSGCDFDLLGELVLQVRGLAGALALSGFSLNLFSLLSFFVYIYSGVGTDLVDSRELSGMGT